MMNKSFKNLLVMMLIMCMPSLMWAQTPGKASYQKAENLRKQKSYSEAIQEYDNAIKLEPTNAKYHYKKAVCAVKLKPSTDANLDLAISELTSATQSNKGYVEAYDLLARVYIKKKDYNKAIQYYGLAFDNDQDINKKIRYKLKTVELYNKTSNYPAAQQALNQAKALAPGDPSILYADGQIKGAMGQWSEALQSYQQALDKVISLPPAQSAKYYFGVGEALYMSGQTAKAEEIWKNCQLTAPYPAKIKSVKNKNNPSLPFKIARAYYNVEEFEEAIKYINKALELSANYSNAHKLMAQIHVKKGRTSDAIASFQKAVEGQTDDKKKQSIYNAMVNLQLNAGDYGGALSTANSILAKSPTNTTVKFKKAKAEYKLGQYSAAIGTVEALIGSETDVVKKAPYQFVLGLSAKKGGDTEKAKKAFAEAQKGPAYKSAAKKELDTMSAK